MPLRGTETVGRTALPVGIAALLFVILLETLIREGRREIIIGDSFHFEVRIDE